MTVYTQHKSEEAMNQRQRRVLFCVAVIIGLLVLFPPYEVKHKPSVRAKERVVKNGYAFLFAMPTVEITTTRKDEGDRQTVKTTIDGKPFKEGVFHYGGLISTGTGISVSRTKKPAEINVSVWVVEILATALAAWLLYIALGDKGKGFGKPATKQ